MARVIISKPEWTEPERESGVQRVAERRDEKHDAAVASIDTAIARKLEIAKGKADGTIRQARPRIRKREVVYAELQEMWANGRISEIQAIHLVELYAYCHSRLYEHDATELDSATERVKAVGAAKRLVEKEFGGDMQRAIDFLKWSWKRESGRDEWRKSQGKERTRMSWSWQFSPRHVVDYRVATHADSKPSRPPPPPPPPGGKETQISKEAKKG